MARKVSALTSDGIGIATEMAGSPDDPFTRLLLRRAEYERGNKHYCPHCGVWHRDKSAIVDLGIRGFRCSECE